MGKAKAKAAEPLLEIDRKARRLFRPWRKTAPVKAIAWFGQAGDQLQLRTLCGGVLVVGVLRGDARMVRAAAQMLAAHELATLAKKTVKDRVDRWRPREDSGKTVAPHKGSSQAKKLNSFPSGHSAGAMAVACAFAAEYPERRGAALAAAGAVGLAQVPSGAHYPSDVAAGLAIGAATGGALGLVWRMVARVWRR